MESPRRVGPTFETWLATQNVSRDAGDRFVPRAAFGRYLREGFAASANAARAAGHAVSAIEREATRILRRDDGYEVRSDDGSSRRYDAVVLCPGTPPRPDPYALAGTPGFVADPFPLRTTLPRIPRDADVLVLGTSLSAVDVVRGLANRGHAGATTLASRRGVLPAVRPVAAPPAPRRFAPAAIAALAGADGRASMNDLRALVLEELDAHGIDRDEAETWLRRDETPEKRLARGIAASADPRSAPAIMHAVLARSGDRAWDALSDRDRADVAQHADLIEALRVPMPYACAVELLAAMRTRRVAVRSGLRSVVFDARSGRYAAATATGEIRTDVVVDATQRALDASDAVRSPLVASLVRDGLAVAHPFGGVRTKLETFAVLDSHGVPQRGLYALGEISRGDHMLLRSFEKIAAAAGAVAERIVTEAMRSRPASKRPT